MDEQGIDVATWLHERDEAVAELAKVIEALTLACVPYALEDGGGGDQNLRVYRRDDDGTYVWITVDVDGWVVGTYDAQYSEDVMLMIFEDVSDVVDYVRLYRRARGVSVGGV